MTTHQPLPEGYSFIYHDRIDPQQVIDLRIQVGWGAGLGLQYWRLAINSALYAAGVKTDQDHLVGTGFVVTHRGGGLVCDLAVHPEHRKKGLARAILADSVQKADAQSINPLFVEVDDQSSLIPFYNQLGFVDIGRFMIRAQTNSANNNDTCK